MNKTSSVSRKTEPRIWEQTYLLNRRLSEDIRTVVSRFLAPERKGRILDVGCGQMPYRHLFEDYCSEYVGCDAYPSLPEVVQCPADALNFEDESFDAVVALQVLEHVPRPWKVVGECARVLRTGGLAVLSAPFLFPYHGSPKDFYRYTHEGLASLCRDAGLEPCAVFAQCTSLGTLFLLVSYYQGIVWNWFGNRTLGKPVALVGRVASTVPTNVLGLLAERVPFRRNFERGITGFSNFIVVARKTGERDFAAT